MTEQELTENQKTHLEEMMTALAKAVMVKDMDEIQRCLQFVAIGVANIQHEIYLASPRVKRGGCGV